MTVAVGGVERERPSKEENVVAVSKRLKGQLRLRRDEISGYREPVPTFEDIHHDRDAGEANDDVVRLMEKYAVSKTSQRRGSAAESRKPKAVMVTNTPSTPNVFVGSPALRRNVRAWCDATGLPTSTTIRFHDRVFHLHKFPLVSRSGFLKRALKDATEITLLDDVVPGGPATFELVSNFCYGSTILMEPANIAELCCVADYLEMTEDYGRANLCERSELYLTQVALQSWDDTLVVLEHCERHAPYAEHLGIVRRCLDALAFMACMELLDPVARKFVGDVKQSSAFYWWVQDLVALPPRLFVKLVLALRSEGMQENYVGQVITAFADRWIFEPSPATHSGHGDQKGHASATNLAALIESVVMLLPLERGVVPIGFLFALLRRGLTCGLNDDCRIQLETRIVLQLENATLHDVLLPGKKERENRCVLNNELESMERILKLFLTRFRAFDDAGAADMAVLSGVTKLWDEYLAEIAFDTSIAPARFAELVERIPAHMREIHDEVYRAVHAYLTAHPSATSEERLTVCRTLNCQKLSTEACAHAVQNDLMPLRMIVQAMFVQQLQTRSVLNSHLESAAQSFREIPDHGARSMLPNSAPLSSHPSAGNSGRHHSQVDSLRSMGSSFRDTDHNDLYIDESVSTHAKHHDVVAPPAPKSDYHATETRLRSLEAELSRMRKTLSQSLIDHHHSSQPGRRQTPTAASTSAPVAESVNLIKAPRPTSNNGGGVPMTTSCSGRSGAQAPSSKMATVHESSTVPTESSCRGESGCMSQLKPVSSSTGLLAKTLQKLKLRSFGSKATKSSCPVDVKALGPRRPAREVETPQFASDMSFLVARTDSMPRPVTRSSQGSKPRHVRRNSMS